MLITCLLLLAAVDGGVPSRVQSETSPGNPGDVSGVVSDDRGAPISAAKLTFQGGTHHKLKTVAAESGADGRFTATAVPPGMYGTSVRIEATGFFPVNYSIQSLSTALSLKIRMSRPVKIEGVISAPDAIGGALGLIETTPGAALHPELHPFSNVSVAADGSFSLEATPGDYELVWSRPSGTPFHAIVRAPSSKLRLAPSNAGIDGQALSLAGAPLAAADVSVRPAAKPLSIGRATTDAQGRFSLRGLEDGDYVVEVKNSDRLCRSQPVTVARGVGKALVRFGTGKELSGQAVDAEGHGKSGVGILVKPVQADGSLGAICDMRAADTDSGGRFTVSDLGDAEVEIAVMAKPEYLRVKAKPGSAPVTITLPGVLPKRTLTGVVLGPDRKPIAGAMVGMNRNFTDDQGRFTLEREEGSSGTVQFYRRCFVAKEVPENETSLVVMERRPCLSTNVVDAAKKPISGMHSLELKRADGTRIAQCTTRAMPPPAPPPLPPPVPASTLGLGLHALVIASARLASTAHRIRFMGSSVTTRRGGTRCSEGGNSLPHFRARASPIGADCGAARSAFNRRQ